MLRRSFRKDERGMAAVEFALIAPLMILLLYGTVEVSNLFSVNRKVTRVANTVADLISQDSIVNEDELDGIFDASGAIMTPPFTPANMKIVVRSVYKDSDGDVAVEWCDARNGGVSGAPELPDNLLEDNSSIILAEVSYEYYPAISVILKAHYTLSDEFYLRPRRSLKVACEDCGC